MKKLLLILIVLTAVTGLTKAGNGKKFIDPFKLNSYYEYIFQEWGYSARYKAEIVSEEMFNGRLYKIMEVYNEPPIVYHTIRFSYDPETKIIYGGSGFGCMDSTGNIIAAGFNMPVGHIWNDNCSSGAFLFSEIVYNSLLPGIFNVSDSLQVIERKDTLGGPVESTSHYVYSEKFGYLYYHAASGGPFWGYPVSKTLVGAIIDGVTYGSILLDVNQISSEVPDGFELYQNYPNPFNPLTTIKFSLPEPSNVRLTIYDHLGREVQTILNERKNSGTYQYLFNAKDLSSGIYFYKLESGFYTKTMKMILIK